MGSITKLIEKEVALKGLERHLHTIRYQISDMLVREVWDSDDLEKALNKKKELGWKLSINRIDTLCSIKLDYKIKGDTKTIQTDFYLHDLT